MKLILNYISSGNILLESLVKFAQSSKIDKFDFTIGNEKYKQKWSNETSELYDVISSNSFYGNFAKIIYFLNLFS